MKTPRWELVLTIIINGINGALQLGLIPAGVYTKLATLAITVLASIIAIVGKPLAGGQAQDGSKLPDPPGRVGSFLLPFLIASSLVGMAIAASGCATLSPAQKAYDARFAACMESKGIAAASAAGQEAWNDLSQGVSQDQTYGQLEGLAGRAGVDTVTCAVSAWMGLTGSMLNPAGVAAGKAWLAAHSPVGAGARVPSAQQDVPDSEQAPDRAIVDPDLYPTEDAARARVVLVRNPYAAPAAKSLHLTRVMKVRIGIPVVHGRPAPNGSCWLNYTPEELQASMPGVTVDASQLDGRWHLSGDVTFEQCLEAVWSEVLRETAQIPEAKVRALASADQIAVAALARAIRPLIPIWSF